MGTEDTEHHSVNFKRYATLLGILQIIIIVLFGVFVRFTKPSDLKSTLNEQYYPAYQDVNVMMLVGFGFLMAFSRSFSWSAVTYTFFMNAILVQLYILLSAFWKRVLVSGFTSDNYYIYINEVNITLALYSAASMFISIGCTIGRVGPLQTLVMCLFHEVGYTLNEVICSDKIVIFDVGGSMLIHAFGAYSGLTISLILTSINRPSYKPATNYFSNLFAFIGTLFLWMFWPSFNYGVMAETAYTKTQIISNTILSLTGSCLATFMTSAYLKNKFTMEHLLNATLAGGVVIGATAGFILHPGGSIAIGFLTGIISTLGFNYLTPYLQSKINLYDTCGVHNLHGIPGLLGGLISAVVAASYNYPSVATSYTVTAVDFPYYNSLVNSPYKQGGLQVAGTFTSIGIGIMTALLCGLVLRLIYKFNKNDFFNDGVYFEQAEEFIEQLKPFNPVLVGTTKEAKDEFAEIVIRSSMYESQIAIR